MMVDLPLHLIDIFHVSYRYWVARYRGMVLATAAGAWYEYLHCGSHAITMLFYLPACCSVIYVRLCEGAGLSTWCVYCSSRPV